jgi:hypothetical protein
MSTSLYFDNDPAIGTAFGVKPKDWPEYQAMSKRINLTTDRNWSEKSMRDCLCKADIWPDFPALRLTLVGDEFQAGDEDQRLDILYLRDDGALLPCELKLGGKSKDTHGQLIRYIADLSFQRPDLAWVQAYHRKFVDKMTEPARGLHTQKFDDFVSSNKISDKFIRVLPRSGIIIDEAFPSQLLKAVRHLNDNCGFSIRLIEARAFTSNNSTPPQTDSKFRLDFNDVQ